MTVPLSAPSDQKFAGEKDAQALNAQSDVGAVEGKIANEDPIGRFLRIGEVSVEVALSRAQIYRLMKDPMNPFPKPIKIGSASRWAFVDIVSWKQKAIHRRDQQAPKE